MPGFLAAMLTFAVYRFMQMVVEVTIIREFVLLVKFIAFPGAVLVWRTSETSFRNVFMFFFQTPLIDTYSLSN